MSISIDASERDGGRLLAVVGEVDVSNAAELRAALEEALSADVQSVEVDLSQVPYIDSTGIGVLVGAAHRAAEASMGFSLTHPQRNVLRVLSLLGVDGELGVKE